MKIIGWIAVLALGSIFVRALIYLGYKLQSRSALNAEDAVILALGLVAIWSCRAVYMALISKKIRRKEKIDNRD